MPRSRGRKGEEWVGGIALFEGAGARGNDVYSLMWIDAGGSVVGTKSGTEHEVLMEEAAECLRATIASPQVGPPRVPARVRVATTALADALGVMGPSIEIVCAATPEVDVVAKLLRAGIERRRSPSYLAPDVDATMIGKLFGALADLYRAAPWTIVPRGRETFLVEIWELGINDGVVAVTGQQGDDLGLIFFPGRAEHRAFVDADGVAEGRLGMPEHMALYFERGADIPAAQRREIAAHGWDVADPHAYPSITIADTNHGLRRYTAREVLWIEITARALASILPRHREALEHAWATGESWWCQTIVDTFAGLKDVTLRIDGR